MDVAFFDVLYSLSFQVMGMFLRLKLENQFKIQDYAEISKSG